MSKIIIVDDTPDVLNTLSGLLKDTGYDVTSVANESEALNAVLNERYAVALIDVRLHGPDDTDASGLSLAFAFRHLDPGIRIILLSRYDKTEQIAKAIHYHGVVAFIDKAAKDWTEQIINTIEHICKETESPKFEIDTQLSLSLTINQPISIRAYGRNVCSTRTAKVLQIEVERYARQAELAYKARDDLRFYIGQIGYNLWRDIFVQNQEIDNMYRESRAKSCLLSIHVEAPRDFLRLPLEFIKPDDPAEYLVINHPFTRFIYGAVPKRQAISPNLLARMKELRILIIASNTEPAIDGVDLETKQLHDFLKYQQDYIPVRVKFIPTVHATYERIKTELEKHQYDIVHYAGHGSYQIESPEESSLYFWAQENKNGNILQMKATELKMLLDRSQVNFVYLSSCYGTATGDSIDLLEDDFLGLADAIIQAGVPSVLGYRWPVSDSGALKLTKAFYNSLLKYGSPEIALWCARRELAAIDRNDTTWLSPILIHQK